MKYEINLLNKFKIVFIFCCGIFESSLSVDAKENSLMPVVDLKPIEVEIKANPNPTRDIDGYSVPLV
ncbi:MAG: hypothetical protein COU72_01415 [Parcubacteria group bacterium CG10_big_fil_rev_8_21_14_0_10_41_35]|nr:MAG: hypothetical protein COU72_01415 [Parcubacteria group bacterium CG10_big_fil_rev_8_21_14_0_10_41_35]PIZ78021.1 MAG: hypothetical protein COY02_04315 [Parcubacteria group bacterium CG_4_10_14_0_2_um_filter_41_6]